ncbi:cell surface glycoprotein (s-layer protein) related protein-like protein [Candidatus Koribacter versatilis Ellin345]|uniref:Cell surface glycoprotein (S-layer protein) related protein-like protein n=1 Tax=Koribacter versatilis (strain Ellin345) TaxID=204669 RepID=Q1IHA4_KORVE|nr:SBBP repeat-containing protein [Candidatus Koribacter versatilis]ABF43746.1 cell surface glycoprotein (s-layer protein) related protein-like protein [Candidatus Koribacter versatilis Ellin345]
MPRHSSLRLLLASLCLLVSFTLPALAQGIDLPLSFEPNLGQSDPAVRFLSHGKGYGIYLSQNTTVLQMGSDRLALQVAGGQAPSAIRGEEPLTGKVNYLRGADRSSWLRGVPTYARVRMSSVYPGVDLVYYGNHRQLEYDFVVHPDADAKQIGFAAKDAELRLNRDGQLTMTAGAAEVHWHAPVAYQEIDGKRHAVEAKYEIAGSMIRFHVGAYDHSHDLVIDPVMVYSTYVGGNGGETGDVGNAIAVDAAGNAYIAGVASSTNFPVTSEAMQPSSRGNDDAFVAKINPQGTGYVYATYLGGGGQDIAWGIAIDGAGNAYVTGQTGSGLHGQAAFPTTAGAYQRTQNANVLNNSVFVAKLSADGTDLLYSTYLTGTNDSTASGIAVDGGGNAYVLTNTAGGFPVSGAAYQKTAGTDQCPYEQFADGQAQVVTKVNATGSALVYSTYVGHGCDYGAGIAVNTAGEAYIVGHTQDSAYPVTSGEVGSTFGGVVDGFVTRLNASGSGIVYSTFLGGSLADFANAVALDSSGYAYIAGGTDGDFPTTSSAYQTTASNNGYRKGFVTKLSPMGKALIYSTYIRGAANVSFSSIAVDKSHYAHVTGYSDGSQYPATSTAVQGTCHQGPSGCLTQAVVTKVNATGSGLLYSSYFGASDASNNYFPGNIGNGIAVDNNGGFYITGRTSAGLKTTSSAAEPSYRSNSNSTDAFVAKFNVYGTSSATKVIVLLPLDGSLVTAKAGVSATALGSSSPVAYMQVYVDGVRKAQVSGSTILTVVSLGTGQHRITAQAINKDSSIAKSTVYVTAK